MYDKNQRKVYEISWDDPNPQCFKTITKPRAIREKTSTPPPLTALREKGGGGGTFL
jgi:hypothetical protein